MAPPHHQRTTTSTKRKRSKSGSTTNKLFWGEGRKEAYLELSNHLLCSFRSVLEIYESKNVRVDCSMLRWGLRVWHKQSALLRVWLKIHLLASGLANLPPHPPDEFSPRVSCIPSNTVLIVIIPPRCALNGLGSDKLILSHPPFGPDGTEHQLIV